MSSENARRVIKNRAAVRPSPNVPAPAVNRLQLGPAWRRWCDAPGHCRAAGDRRYRQLAAWLVLRVDPTAPGTTVVVLGAVFACTPCADRLVATNGRELQR